MLDNRYFRDIFQFVERELDITREMYQKQINFDKNLYYLLYFIIFICIIIDISLIIIEIQNKSQKLCILYLVYLLIKLKLRECLQNLQKCVERFILFYSTDVVI
eukprot:TRINITY_DN2851_c0_g3_i2.p6 TRINITY_DN2851_c0_g3~~TRINITY_DN2851_c0_g3_i2.p6  ORF type:complete len:104 (-),score=0.68 TRINITY_DN2851_c0_g3_i2:451-762(-)